MGDGRRALAKLEQQAFELVLDLEMPEMDGLDAAIAIRVGERMAGGHLPIVAMTAHALSGDRERCLQAGMDEFLTKPIDRAKLRHVIGRLFGNQNHGSVETVSPVAQ